MADKNYFSIIRMLTTLMFVLTLSGCAWLTGEKDETENWSARKFYAEARTAMIAQDYSTAIGYFEKLEARYPFGKYAEQAQLEIAYAYYKYDEPDAAIAAADRFIKIHPGHANVDYAFYLKGLANFNRGLGFFSRFIPMDVSQRDPGASKDSFEDFASLVKKYPSSKYVEDARTRMIFLRNTLAQYHVNVANYYIRRGANIAAINRARHVIEKYQETPAVPKAVSVLNVGYSRLGLDQLAADADRVLALNYPNGMPVEPTKGVWDMLGLDK